MTTLPAMKSPPQRPPPPAGKPVANGAAGKAATISGETIGVSAPKLALVAMEGWGKTTCAAFMPKPVIIMAGSETGYLMLRDHGLAPRISSAVTTTWAETLATLNAIEDGPKQFESIALDAIGGFEWQCHQHVCRTEFNNDWGEKGFRGYQRGYDHAAIEWVKLLSRLEGIRNKHGMTVMMLSHVRVATFKNPEGPDYDRYTSNVHQKVWDLTKQWCSGVFFGNFITAVSDEKKRKAVGGDTRSLATVHSASYDAKNLFSMDPLIEIPDDPGEVWNTISNAMKGKSDVA